MLRRKYLSNRYSGSGTYSSAVETVIDIEDETPDTDYDSDPGIDPQELVRPTGRYSQSSSSSSSSSSDSEIDLNQLDYITRKTPTNDDDDDDDNTRCPISSRTGIWLTYIWDVPLSCPTAQPLLPKSHLPKPNWADSGSAKIKVNPTKVRDLMEHPVVTTVRRSASSVSTCKHFPPLKAQGRMPRSSNARSTDLMLVLHQKSRGAKWSCFRHLCPKQTRGCRGTMRPANIQGRIDDI